jgi:hypothetical protein
LAISAYSEKGLLKKHPLLGTSLAVDTGRGVEREKFGKLHERAVGFQGTKAEFQKSIQGEYEATRDKGLAAFTKSSEALAGTEATLADYRKQMRASQNIQRQNTQIQQLIQSGDMSKGTAFEKANPEIAKQAQELWDLKQASIEEGGEGLRKKDVESYYKGKRSKLMKAKYENLATEMGEQEKILNEKMPGLLKQLAEQQKALGARGGQGKGIMASKFQDLAQDVSKGLGGAFGPAGNQLVDFEAWAKDPLKNAMEMVDPTMGAYKDLMKGDVMGGLKTFAMGVLDPGNLGGIIKSIMGISGAKKEKRKAMRSMRAGGRVSMLHDELGYQSAQAGLANLQSALGLATSSAIAGTQRQTVAQQRKTLEDQANFYGSFFS